MNNEFWESARKEGDYEAYMEGITNMLYQEAMFDYCVHLNLKNECFCGEHTHKDCGNKQYCGMTEDDKIEVGNLFDIKYQEHVTKKGRCSIHNTYKQDGVCPVCDVIQSREDEIMDMMEKQAEACHYEPEPEEDDYHE